MWDVFNDERHEKAQHLPIRLGIKLNILIRLSLMVRIMNGTMVVTIMMVNKTVECLFSIVKEKEYIMKNL